MELWKGEVPGVHSGDAEHILDLYLGQSISGGPSASTQESGLISGEEEEARPGLCSL